MATLSLFPAHVQFVDAQGRLTPEAYRALQMLYSRTGGSFGDQGIDTFGGVFSASDSVSTMLDVTIQPSSETPISTPDITQSSDSRLMSEMVFQPEVIAQPILPITPGASPWTYYAYADGNLALNGVSITSVTLRRGSVSVALNNNTQLVHLSEGDALIVVYTVAPTVHFIPR